MTVFSLILGHFVYISPSQDPLDSVMSCSDWSSDAIWDWVSRVVSRTKQRERCDFHRAVLKQVAQLSQRDRAAGWASSGQKWKTVFCRQYTCTSIFNHC